MNSPNALLERPEVEVQPFNRPDLSVPYSPLSTFIVSSLLEHDGRANTATMQNRLERENIPAESVMPFMEKTLVRHGLVEIEDDVLTATASGTAYIARHTKYVDEIYQQNSVKMPHFAPALYEMLNFMQTEAVGPNGLLLPKNNTATSVFDHLRDKLDWSRVAVSKKINELQRSGRITLEYWSANGAKGRFVSNSQITPQGEADLEEMRISFPEKIVELEEGGRSTKKPPKTRELRTEELRGAFISITDEINNMLAEMGKAPRDFTKLEQGTDSELRAAIKRLRPIMQTLEMRLDAANPKLLR